MDVKDFLSQFLEDDFQDFQMKAEELGYEGLPLSQNHGKVDQSTGGKMKKRVNKANSVENRERKLERNRAAASRSRTRKKELMQGYDQKATQLAAANGEMRSEIDRLEREIEQYKAILAAKATNAEETSVSTGADMFDLDLLKGGSSSEVVGDSLL